MNQNIFIVERSDLNVSGTVAANATLIVAPGPNRHIVVTSFAIQNESQVATTIILRNGPADCWRCYAPLQGDGLAMNFPPNHPWKLGNNLPLAIALSGANACGYSIQYYIK